MGRKFNTKKKAIRAPTNTVYLTNPVGSNEWHKEKRVQMFIRNKNEKEKEKEKKAIDKKKRG